MRARTFLLVTVLFSACSSPPSTGLPDELDAGSAAGSDAGHTDGGAREGGDGEPTTELSSTCEGACRQVALSAHVGATMRGFDRVQFGFTSPQKSARGRWELRLEAHGGGDPECPGAAPPTADRTVVISGVVVPSDRSAQTRDGGVSLVLLDIEGALTNELALRATSVTFTPSAAHLCPGCPAGAGSPEQFLAFDVSAVFPDGGMSGHGFAQHCPSLDEL